MTRNRTVGVSPRDLVWEFINELMFGLELEPKLDSFSKVEPEKCPFGAFSKLPGCPQPTFANVQLSPRNLPDFSVTPIRG